MFLLRVLIQNSDAKDYMAVFSLSNQHSGVFFIFRVLNLWKIVIYNAQKFTDISISIV